MNALGFLLVLIPAWFVVGLLVALIAGHWMKAVNTDDDRSWLR